LDARVDVFKSTTFEPVKITRLRIEVTPRDGSAIRILEWRGYNAGPVPSLSLAVDVGVDTSVILGAPTYLNGKGTWLEDSRQNVSHWSKISVPRNVAFEGVKSQVMTRMPAR
jgi:hypothetical protein